MCGGLYIVQVYTCVFVVISDHDAHVQAGLYSSAATTRVCEIYCRRACSFIMDYETMTVGAYGEIVP